MAWFMKGEVAIVAAKRTAIGNFCGMFSKLGAHVLSAPVLKALIKENAIAPEEVSEVIIGQVLTALSGQNPARQSAVEAGLPYIVPAFTVNQVCGSGLKSVVLAVQSIMSGENIIVIAGGQENMSVAPHAAYLRKGVKMGDVKLSDTIIHDGLTDIYNMYHMGVTAENIAEQYGISREEQDVFAVSSQNKAEDAQKSGRFKDEIVVIDSNDKDEYIRYGANLGSLAKLGPVFKKDGTVTAGNASGVNDGAAAVLLMSTKEAERRKLPIMARIISAAQSGCDPKIMGIAPVDAINKALKFAMWKEKDLDCIESNEAFAVQSIAVDKEIGWDKKKVNMSGGAIALGHPIGASGTRCLVTLLHRMQQDNLSKGLISLCIGGGMGIAMCVEK